MPFEIHPGEGPGVYVLEGELDAVTVSRLDDTVDHTADGRLILDIERLTFIDSTGLRALIRIALERPQDDPVVLRHPSASAERVLQVAVPDGIPGLEIDD